ncbi:hypothetical protein [Companilactobacillus musae]|uniref:hypothetical protein n=1 Tax=Companilactobacillus musae TaxID=1903258 RepID=UPI000E64AACA|nr:hypothetical protein [Companilactobacillus musae]
MLKTILSFLQTFFYINIEGLGWKIVFYLLIILVPLLFWFKDNRYKYENFLVRVIKSDEFNKISYEMKVELQYNSDDISNVKRTWIFGSNEFPSKIELFEYNIGSDKDSGFLSKLIKKFHKKTYEESYKKITNSITLDPGNFVAFNLTTSEGLPVYRVKVEMNGMIAWIDIHYQLRYNTDTNDQNRIKFKQTFISFLKSKIAE